MVMEPVLQQMKIEPKFWERLMLLNWQVFLHFFEERVCRGELKFDRLLPSKIPGVGLNPYLNKFLA